MPRPVNVNFPEASLKEVETLAIVLGRSYSSTMVKMLNIGIAASKEMAIEDINGPKEDPWGKNDSIYLNTLRSTRLKRCKK